jgi:hypothetical protein
MSPASTTFDALGLVKQINEQNAPALEEAHELLASGTLQNLCSEENSDKENIEHIIIKKEHAATNQPSKVMVRKVHWCLIMDKIADGLFLWCKAIDHVQFYKNLVPNYG